MRPMRPLALLLAPALVAVACGDDGGDDAGDGGVVRVLAHESFALSPEVLDRFTDDTGIEVELLLGEDAGSVVNQAILTRDRPQADVLFGIDTMFLTRGLDEDLFEPYESPALDTVPADLVIDDRHRVTPVDRGDVCINYDTAYFDRADAPPVPQRLEDLTDPTYRGLLVVEDPATSSPGLAFVAGTIAAFGEDGWERFWRDLAANDVEVTPDWSAAYYGEYSAGSAGAGDRPLVVSYASSPPVEVVFADPPIDEPLSGVIEGTCVQQVEYAGILANAAHPEAARRFIDFLLGADVQADLPLTMYVFPIREGTALPEVFERFAVLPDAPIVIDPFEFGASRDEVIRRWDELVRG